MIKPKNTIFLKSLYLKLGIASGFALAVFSSVVASPVYGAAKSTAPSTEELQNSLSHNPIVNDIQKIVDFLAAVVIVAVIGSVIFAGIQYSLAGDKAEAVSKAKSRISGTALALAIFLFASAILEWLIPGGIFTRGN
jgi:preprotein translocase subunit SecY